MRGRGEPRPLERHPEQGDRAAGDRGVQQRAGRTRPPGPEAVSAALVRKLRLIFLPAVVALGRGGGHVAGELVRARQQEARLDMVRVDLEERASAMA